MKIIDKTIQAHKGVNDNKPQYIVVHHTAGNGSFETVRRYHVDQRGWEAIGYTYFINSKGTIYLGRPETTHGGHTKGLNKKSIGIALQGNFSIGQPTEAQEKSLKWLVTDIKTRHNIKDMGPHRKWAATECFGKNMPDNWLHMLMDEKENCVCLSKATKNQLINEFVSRF